MIDFAVYRFVAGLGVGGRFRIGCGAVRGFVAGPGPPARPRFAAGSFAVGNMVAGITAVILGYLQAQSAGSRHADRTSLEVLVSF
jgi:hypothetical protein